MVKNFTPLLSKKERIFNFDEPVTITLLSFLIVVLLARFISYLILRTDELPDWLFVSVRGYRLHHFVYGNIILASLGFAKFVLEAKISKRITALVYGVGLGLVIDEFTLWSGGLTYLLPHNVYVFNTVNTAAVFVMTFILVFVIHKKRQSRQKKYWQTDLKI